MRLYLCIFLALSAAVSSCRSSGDGDSSAPLPGPPPNAQSLLDSTGTQKLLALVHDYYLLKDALVAGNAAQTGEAAQKLIASTQQLDNFLVQDSVNTIKLIPYTDSLLWGTSAMLAVKDETTEQQRVKFETVSNAVYNIIVTTGLKNAGIYRMYCPMALNDKGAYWLSYETEVRNPYFGTKMLECGEVTDTL